MADLSQLLVQQKQTLAQLASIATEQKTALEAQNAERLLELNANQQQALVELAQTDEQIKVHPQQATLTQDTGLAEQVAEIKQQLASVQQQSQANKTLIDLNLASLQRFQQALMASRNANSLTYDDKGQTNTQSTLGNSVTA
ncbi:flagellar export chaperone FlgN [Paraferrimonas sedimenticola]|uniref:Flagellar protein FlgN n=1 Tax=Paraferrimonas sedimenticola TaxID=375674 RepID=A0AA37RTI3_9GAMM|nr:flagellar export chaperone FlgN [Paraferrimonas sedimenticola]GLP94999.1 flagellar protein FlgN [Paraferrimonas sedimenticola]